MTTQDIRFRLGIDGAQQVQQGAAQAAQSIERLGTASAKVGQQNQLTGQQTAQLSAQLQDLFVQIQAGGSPITALLQQGSQLSAVFGGTGNALRAVGSLITPTVAALGLAGAALGGVAAAFAAGYKESKAFADALALTGNAAGITEGRFNSLADSIGARTQAGVGTAREALQALVASGRVSGQALEATAAAAAALSRATGEGAEDVAKRFAGLTDNVAEGARKLNEQYNFLTAAQYRQIKALEDQGNAQQAVAETMRALEGRVNTTVQNLGDLERAWLGVKNAIGGAVDAMKDIGRTPTIEGEIDRVSRQLASARGRADRFNKPGGGYIDQFFGRRASEEAAELEKVLAKLRESKDINDQIAKATGERAAQERAGIRWIDEGSKYLSRRQQMEREIAQARQLAAAAGKGPDDPELLARIAAITEKYAEAKKKSADAFAAERAAAQQWAATFQRLDQIQQEATASGLGLSKAQAEILKYLESPEYAKHSEAMRQLVVEKFKAAQAAIEHAEAEKSAAKAIAEANRTYTQHVETMNRQAAAAEGQVQRMEDEARAAAMAASQQISLAEALAMVTIERLREKQAAMDIPDAAAYNALEREIQARERLLVLMRDRRAQDANQRAAEQAGAAWQRMADDAGAALTNALMDGGRDAGEYLKNYFKTLVLRPLVQAAVQPIANTVLQLLGAATGSGGAAGGGVNWLQTASTAQSLYNAYQGGGLAGSAAAAGNYASVYSGSAYGTGFGTQQSAMLAAQESGMVSSAGASSMAAWAGYAAAVIAAYMGSRSAWEAGYNNENLEGAFRYSPESTFTDLLKIGGMSDRSANIWGGGAVYTKLFGRAAPKVMDTGVMGTLRGGDFTGLSFADIQENGGWFRSDKNYTETKAVASSVDMFFDDAAAAILKKAGEYGKALGLPAEQLASISTDIKVSLGDDAEKNKQAIIEALAKYGDALVQGFADQVAPLQQYGESVSATLQRVGGAIVGVNQVLGALGLEALQASISGGQAAVQLQQLFGGIDQFGAAAGSYASKFYSEAERTSMQAEAVAKALATVSLQMPATRDGFRDLVEAQDLSTDAGRRAFTVLLANADAFDAVATSADQAREKLEQEAAQRAQSAKQIVDANIGKFLGAADFTHYRLAGVSKDLGAAGVPVSIQQLAGASKADILGFVNAMVNLADGASETELAVLKAAAALGDLKDEAAAAEQAAADAAADAAQAARAETAATFAQLAQLLVQNVRSAYQQVQQQVESESQRLRADAEERTRAIEQDADKAIRELEGQARDIERTFSSLLNSVDDNVRKLRGDLAGDDGRGEALNDLRAALSALQSGQSVDFDRVREAAGTAADIDPSRFASRFDFQREQARTAQLLRDIGVSGRQGMTNLLGGIAAQQVAIEDESEKQIKAIERARDEQLAALNEQLREAQGIAGTLLNIDRGIGSVAEAMAALRNAAQGAQANTSTWVKTGGQEVWASPGGAVATRPQAGTVGHETATIQGRGTTFTAAEAIAWVNDRLQAGDLIGIYARAVAEGIDSRSLDALMGWAPGTSLKEALRLGLPAFATGTAFVPSTGPAIVHEGERIIKAADNAALMRMMAEGGGSRGDAAMRDELAAMRGELMLALHAIAKNTGKAAQALDDAASGVNPLLTEVTA